MNGCKYTHHELLHTNRKAEAPGPEITEIITSTWTSNKKQSFLKIVPVQIEGSKATIDTYALLDDGSTVTLIDDSVADRIGARGPVDPLRIQTVNSQRTAETASRRVSFKIKGASGFKDKIEVRTVRNLQISSQRISMEHLKECPHLDDIRGGLTYYEVKPEILIGQDNWHLLLSSQVRRGNKHQPVASRTPLGWVLHGSLKRSRGRHVDVVSHVTEASEDNFEKLVKRYFDKDAVCLNPRRPKTVAEENTLRILKDKPTKSKALRIVMSLFDPLGFASPVTIKAKQFLQELWRRGIDWDAKIERDLAEDWSTWTTCLCKLQKIVIVRKYLNYSDVTTVHLHVFIGASDSAYAAVLFWRVVAPNGEVVTSLIVAKAKVAPLKLTSIPRLELQAAVMGTRIADTVIQEHERKPDKKIFWTDSKTILTWIRTGSRSYKPFVAHRLAAVEESTSVSEWRWVPTKLNVADDATRDVPASFNKYHRWYKGPDFLYEEENSWPKENIAEKREEDASEEKVHHVANKEAPRLSECVPDASRFSNWHRLRYATARVLQFIQLCKYTTAKINYKRTSKNTQADQNWKKSKKTNVLTTRKIVNTCENNLIPLTAETLAKAEKLLMCASQEDAFTSEVDNLKNNRSIHKESRLKHLSVEYINGAITLRSRISAAKEISDKVINPVVLDGDHPTVRLWIKAIHRRLHHAGVESTVNECRQQYWVLRIRPVTRTIIRTCFFCRMRIQTPPYPRTGDLPACRLAHQRRPFTYTGVDYFSPLLVVVGRAKQKRYVAIFTCLTTRAIHLEIAGSLITDSAIMALRRMIARRGCPTEICSDNGTNLRGADKELREAIDKGTAEEATKRTIAWRYIPPGAPFMGGAWERLIKSVKIALGATLHEHCPTEEVLSTLLSEAEYTVNSRPLTHVSVSAEDLETLTPNHFLLGSFGMVPLPGAFLKQDTMSKSKWRAAQRLADVFWTRWVKEYLPDLQHRREPHGRGHPVEVNDLVQVVDPNLPRNIWVRGRVIAVYPGPDNVVRTVDIQTKGGVLRRPVRKLVVLPVSKEEPPAPTDSAKNSHGGRDVRDDSST